MRDKNDLIVIQNFSAEEFTKNLIDIIKKEIEILKNDLGNKREETYLTRKETAERFRISLTCLNDWCKKEILLPHKLGNRTYFKLSDIEEKLNNSNLR